MSAWSLRGFPVEAVAIGASAGGIEALGNLLPALPATLRVPVFVVLHLPPGQPSLLVEIFSPKCAVPVVEAEDKTCVEPGVIYFAPPDYHLLVDRGPLLVLSADEPVRFSRPSVDALFESAADVYGKGLAGIVLTGATDDGAEGLLAIHRAGGLTLVQEPSQALAPAMPRMAHERCPAARPMTLEDMSMQLREALGASEARP